MADEDVEAAQTDLDEWLRMLGVAGTIVRTERTSYACPAQWDAWNDRGEYLYLRYRGGHGSVHKGESLGTSNEDVRNWKPAQTLIASFNFGHPLDGVIELEQFCKLAHLALADEIESMCFGHYFARELRAALNDAIAERGGELPPPT